MNKINERRKKILEREKKLSQESIANKNSYLLDTESDVSTMPSDLSYIEDVNEYLDSSDSSDDSSSWYKNIWNGIKNVFAEDLPNAHRMAMNLIAEGNVERKEMDLIDIDTEKEDLLKIKDYKAAIQRRNSILKSLEDPNSLGGFKSILELNSALGSANQTINDLQNYFLGEGRTHKTIAELMFDNSRLSTEDAVKVWGREMRSAGRGEGGLYDMLASLPRMGVRAVQSMWDGVVTGAKYTGDLVSGKNTDTRNSEAAIQYIMRSKDPNDWYVNKMFRGEDVLLNDLSLRIDDRLGDLKRQKEQKLAELEGAQQFVKDGIGLFGIDWYDYEDVPEQWKKNYLKYQKDDSFLAPIKHPIYGGIDMSFTIGQSYHMFTSMTADAATRWLIGKLPTWVGPGKLAKYAKGALLLGDVGVGLQQSIQARQEETLNEAMGAMAERVAQEASALGSDLNKVREATFLYAEKLGINTEGYDDEKMIKLALALGVNTGDEAFDIAAKRSAKGINKLINANNALSMSDFAQSLPLMSYWGDAVMKSKKYLMGIENATPNIIPDHVNIVQRFTDWTIDKAAKQFFKKEMPNAALKIKRVGDYAMRKALLAAYEGATEMGEEGVQNLLTSRYKRGEYDDYSKETTVLPFEEIVENPAIASTAFLDYLGLGYYDPDNGNSQLRKEMVSGFWSSVMFSQALHPLTNFSKHRSDNIRGLVRQMKDDKALLNIVTGLQKAVQDEIHLRQFYDAFENGRTWDGMIDTFEQFKKALPYESSIVTKEDIDADTELMSSMWLLYNDKKLAEEMAENGIIEHSDDHKQLLVNGAKAITDARKTEQLLSDQEQKVVKQQTERIDSINRVYGLMRQIEEIESLDHISENEAGMLEALKNRLNEVKTNNPKLINVVEKIRLAYKSFLEDRINPASREKLFENYVNTFKKKNGKFDSKKLESDSHFKRAAKELEILPQQLERTESDSYDLTVRRVLRKAFKYMNHQRFMDSVNNEKDFVTNSYLATYINNTEGKDVWAKGRLQEIYRDPEQREQFVQKVLDSVDSENGVVELQDVAEEVWVNRMARMMDNHTKASVLKKLHRQLNNQKMLLWALRRTTGLDLDISGLQGIVDNLKDRIDKGTKNFELYDEFLKKHDLAEPEIGNDADYKKLSAIYFLNEAVLPAQQQVADAYFLRTNNPRALGEAIFGKGNIPSEMMETIKQYEKIKADSDAKSQLDRLRNEEDVVKHDQEVLSKKAAWKIIKDQLQNTKERKRIARRRYWEDQIDDTFNRNVEGVSADGLSDSEDEDPTKPNTGAYKMSQAEELLRRKYNHERNRKSIDEKIEEKKKESKKNADAQKEPSKNPDPLEKEAKAHADEPKEVELKLDDDIIPEVESGAEIGGEEEGGIVSDTSGEDAIGSELGDAIETHTNDEDFGEETGEDEDDFGSEEEDEDSTIYSDEEDVLSDESLESEDDPDMYFDDEEDDIMSVEEDEGYIMDQYGQEYADENGTVPTENLPGVAERKSPKNVCSDDLPINLYWQTAFYKHLLNEGEEETIPIVRVNGLQIKTINGKPIKTGIELGKKLATRGWFSTTKKYYIVTQSELSKNVKEGADPRDAFTVALCIEDKDGVYLSFYKSLGVTVSLGEDGSEWTVDDEQILRNDLYLKGIDTEEVAKYTKDNEAFRNLRKRKGETKEHFQYRKTSSIVSAYRFAVNDRAYQLYLMTLLQLGNGVIYGIRAVKMEDGTLRYESDMLHRKWFESPDSLAEEKKQFKQLARAYFAKGKTKGRFSVPKTYSEERIDAEIQRLRDQRNAVIDAYLNKNKKGEYIFPAEIKPDLVHPSYASQSNGKINIDKKNRKFRNIPKETDSVEDIQDKIQNGELCFGFGKGFRPKLGGSWNIVSTEDVSDVICTDGGYAGKIYYVVTGPGEGNLPVPIMLREERINQQERVSKDGKSTKTVYISDQKDSQVRLCLQINKSTGKLENINSEYKPSLAEVVFYMILGQVNLPIDVNSDVDAFVKLFLNCDENTLLDNDIQDAGARYQFFKKQFAYTAGSDMVDIKDQLGNTVGQRRQERSGTKYLYIAMRDKETGEYVVKKKTKEEALSDPEFIQDAVLAISTQLHWNTEVEAFSESGTLTRLVQYLVDLDIRNGRFSGKSIDEFLNSEVSLFGCKQLSFRIGDFYKKGSTDQIADRKPINTTVLSWMLKTGKLKTDAKEELFFAPFVYANGVKEMQTAEKKAGEQDSPIIEQAGTGELMGHTSSTFFGSESIKAVESLIEDLDEITISNSEEVRKNKLENFLKILNDKENYDVETFFKDKFNDDIESLVDFILLQPDIDNEDDADDYNDSKEERIEKFVLLYNKENKTSFSKDDVVHVNDTFNVKSKNKNAREAIVIYKNKKGETKIVSTLIHPKDRFNKTRKVDTEYVLNSNTGVFSTRAASDTMDEKEAREWLEKTLGIELHNIYVQDAALRHLSNGAAVYGLVNLAFDSILRDTVGVIELSILGGRGVHYHEAFHYVNLLMNSMSRRDKIYQDYYERNKSKYKDHVPSNREIEEDLAEDFRIWMEHRNPKTLLGKVRKFFVGLFDLLIASRKRGYKELYEQIRTGKFNMKNNPNITLDLTSKKEFERYYPEGAFEIDYYTSGTTAEERKNTIALTHNELYEAANAIGKYCLLNFQVASLADIDKLTNTDFADVMKSLKDWVKELQQISPQRAKLVENILDNNVELAKRHIQAAYLSIQVKVNISLKTKKSKKLDEVVDPNTPLKDADEDATARENRPDMVFDRFDLASSKKANSAFEVKRFLMTIPKTHYEMDETQESGRKVVFEKDNFGLNKIEDFRVVWNRLSSLCWRCKSVDAIDENTGKYKEDSILGMLEREMKYDSFFKIVYDRIKQLDDIDAIKNIILKSQIYSTLNSSNPQVSQIVISSPTVNSFVEDLLYDDIDTSALDFVSDREKKFVLLNDNSYKAAMNLPRKWSARLTTCGMQTVNKDGDIVVDSKFTTRIRSLYDKINASVAEIEKLTTRSKERDQKIEDLLNQVVTLLNEIGIDIDDNMFRIWMSLYYKDTKPSTVLKFIKNRFCADDESGNSILHVIKSIINSAGKKTITLSKQSNRERALDEVFNNLNDETDIYKLATAHSIVRPSSQEFSITGPNGETHYPIGMNNSVTSECTELSINGKQRAKELRRSPYCKHCIILDAAEETDPVNSRTHITPNAFTGMSNFNKNGEGEDYFEMSPLEDYITKLFLLENDHLVLPTMADKKTYYSLYHKSFKDKLSHNIINTRIPEKYLEPVVKDRYRSFLKAKGERDLQLIGITDEASMNSYIEDKWKIWYNNMPNAELKQEIDEAAKDAMLQSGETVDYMRFGENTLNMFAGYLLDEINTCLTYYSKDNIDRLLKNTTLLENNYHGKLEMFQGKPRMKFGGNGGLFRYFYDIIPGENINQHMQFLWKLLRDIEEGKVHDGNNPEMLITADSAITPEDRTGFEMIYNYLKGLKDTYFVEGTATNDLLNIINAKLIKLTYDELEDISRPNSAALIAIKTKTGFKPRAIPTQMLLPYARDFAGNRVQEVYGKDGVEELALFSLIGNYVANSITSIIEFEKVFAGDPAFFKWSYIEDENRNRITEVFKEDVVFADGTKCSAEYKVDLLQDSYSDKIKRLGSLLSPGDQVRTEYSETELQRHPELAVKQYTNLVIKDAKVKSTVLDSHIIPLFKALLIIDFVRNRHASELAQLAKDNNLTVNQLIDKAFYDKQNDVRDTVGDKKLQDKILSLLSEIELDRIQKELESQIDPYTNINVADAQVLMRPAFYRRIRIGLGNWSKKDEQAYWILENAEKDQDGKWLHGLTDKKVRKAIELLCVYPLKMSYYKNDPVKMFLKDKTNGKDKIYQQPYNKPVLNKLAIFPAFKFLMTSTTGLLLYRRMNRKGNEIDCVSFESAVKAGANQTIPNSIDKSASVENALGVLSADLQKNSSASIVYFKDDERGPIGTVVTKNPTDKKHSDNLLPITVQNIVDLRMQLNTSPHDANERSIGTQMFKIAFSNIIEDVVYKGRSGKELRTDIMRCIRILTQLGTTKVLNRFFEKRGEDYVVKEDEVKQFVNDIIKSQGIGVSAEDLINQNNTLSSVMVRKIFEHSVFSYVTKEVVDIKTQGGTAILQSSFGFVSLDNSDVRDQFGDDYIKYNDGKELKWNKEDGSMEVLLSIKFFDKVLPKEYKDKSFADKRKWLIEHDLINGTKEDGSQSKPKPFGIGYRIPTQGLSSMFGFTVADVLPSNVGDLIVVPREFTALTGSDFDVDKLYLATFLYKDGELIKEDPDNPTQASIANTLLQDYLDVITDVHNYADSRASIDVFTSMLKQYIVKPLSKGNNKYLYGMSLLTPAFQMQKKREFMTGKFGIGAFALNITNLALTQFMHLTMNYHASDSVYNFGHFDKILGQDDRRISGWLSAMVNAHVDVAKDPYIFILNVNSATYNYTNFLLRAGKGLGTFTFLTQDVIRGIADELITKDGIYGGNLEKANEESPYYSQLKRDAISRQASIIKENLLNLMLDNKDDLKEGAELYDIAIRYVDFLTKKKYEQDRALADFKGEETQAPDYYKKYVKKSKAQSNKISDVSKVFDSKIGMEMHGKKDGTVKDQFQYWMFLLNCLVALQDIDKYATAMSKLVKRSQIDTKKFGNDFAKSYNFLNSVLNFIDESDLFTINNEEFKIGLDGKKKSRINQSREALEMYFNEMFLMDKLTKTIDCCSDILKDQLIPATPYYRQVMTQVCKVLFGSTKTGYLDITDEDLVETIYNAVDDVLRYKALSSSIVQESDEQYILDLTCGGDFNTLFYRIDTIINGDANNNIPPLYTRLALFKDKLRKMKKADLKKKYRDILDSEDNLNNALLLILTPEGPGRKYPNGRITLYRSLIDIDTDEEASLISSFAQLLNSSNDEVRTLAEDLVFYAYYTSYDQNVKNSFFCLVPPPYRKQYDDAISSSIGIMNSNDEEQLAKIVSDVQLIIDIVSRNFWYQPNLIKEFSDSRPKQDFGDPNKGGTVYSKHWFSVEGSKVGFPAWIATTKVPKHLTWIKLVHDGKVVIYRRIGTINRYSGDKAVSPYHIFAPVPKAGLHKGAIHSYELYCDYTHESVYEANKLPNAFNHESVRIEVEAILNSMGEGAQLAKFGLDAIEYPEWMQTNDPVPFIYNHSNERSYTEPDTDDEDETHNKTKFTFLNVPHRKDDKNKLERTHGNGGYLQYRSAVVINFIADDEVGKEHGFNITKNANEEKKVIDIKINSGFTSDDIQNIINAIKSRSDKDPIIFITKTNAAKILVTEDDINRYLKEANLSDKKLKKYKENRELLESAVRQNKLNNMLLLLADKLNDGTIEETKELSFSSYWDGGYYSDTDSIKNHSLVDAIIFTKNNSKSLKTATIGVNNDARFDGSYKRLLKFIAFSNTGVNPITQSVDKTLNDFAAKQETLEQKAMKAILESENEQPMNPELKKPLNKVVAESEDTNENEECAMGDDSDMYSADPGVEI